MRESRSPLKSSFLFGNYCCPVNFCNYSDPLFNVENLRDGVIYKDDFNGLRDSLICAWKISDKLLYFNKINAIFVWLFELFCVSLCL